jgi:hypothetical protein
MRAIFFKYDGLSDILYVKGLLRGYSEDVVLAEFSINASHPLAGQSQPGARPCVAVVHDELTLLILDFCVVGGDALVHEPYMRLLRLADAYGVVVFEDGAVGRFVVWFFELEFDDALVDILNGGGCTFFTMTTFIYTS